MPNRLKCYKIFSSANHFFKYIKNQHVTLNLEEMNDEQKDLVQVVRLALAEQTEDVRLFVARLIRKYRKSNPELAEQLNLLWLIKQPCNGIHSIFRHR